MLLNPAISPVDLAGALGVDCRAFLQEPAARPETGRRPVPKATAGQTAPKRPRGRPWQAK